MKLACYPFWDYKRNLLLKYHRWLRHRTTFNRNRFSLFKLSCHCCGFKPRQSCLRSEENAWTWRSQFRIFTSRHIRLRSTGQKIWHHRKCGVLHHMDNPIVGWKTLVDLLRPGGLMKIGLYSELARSHIIKIRGEVVSQGLGTSEPEIRNLAIANQFKRWR